MEGVEYLPWDTRENEKSGRIWVPVDRKSMGSQNFSTACPKLDFFCAEMFLLAGSILHAERNFTFHL